jgi:putative hydrolase of the HAD superfamily
MRFDALLFDLGDTLLYFDGVWPDVFSQGRAAMLTSLQAAGLDLGQDFLTEFFNNMQAYYRERDTEFIEYTVGYVLRTTLAKWGYTEAPEAVVRQALEAMHHVTQAHWRPEAEALPVLRALRGRGYRLGLVSNAADDANTQVLVDKLGARPYFDVILSSAAVGVRKPNPRILLRALEALRAAPQRAAMIGDTLGADILGARNAGIFGIWVRRRADTPANRAHVDTIVPDAEVQNLNDLPELFDRLEQAAQG